MQTNNVIQFRTKRNQTQPAKTIKGARMALLAIAALVATMMAARAHGMSKDSLKLLNEAKSRAEAELAELQTAHQTSMRERIAKTVIGETETEAETAIMVSAIETK